MFYDHTVVVVWFSESLGGVWRFQQLADKISLGECDDDDGTDVTDDSALNTPQPNNTETVAFFDPLFSQEVRKNVLSLVPLAPCCKVSGVF